MEKIRERFRKKTPEASPWGAEKEKTEAYPAETYRLKLLKMPRSVVSRRWFIGGLLVLGIVLSGLCLVGEAGVISMFFMVFSIACYDYYRFLGRIRVDS